MPTNGYRSRSRGIHARLVERQDYGLLRGVAYSPALVVRELPKIGRVHRIACWRFGQRQYHLAADTEFATFLHEYFRNGVLDIRERVPAQREETLELALRLGLRHPGGTRDPRVLTTDFVVTVERDGRVFDEAICVTHYQSRGPGSDEGDVGELALLTAYWQQRGVALYVALSHGLNSAWARNLAWLYPTRERIERDGISDRDRAVQRHLLEELHGHDHWSAAHACRSATLRYGLKPGASVLAFRQLLAQHRLVTDLDAPSLLDLPPSAFTVVANGPAAR